MTSSHFVCRELKQAISSSKSNSSPGNDSISYQLIKYLPVSALLHLLHIYNQLWHSNTFVPDCRNSIIIPIPKANQDPALIASYRPIALTSTFCKIYERIVTSRLRYYLESNNLLSSNQSGFRQSRSTLDRLIKLHNAAHLTLQTKRHTTRAIFLDYSKAFDLVWTEGLYSLNSANSNYTVI